MKLRKFKTVKERRIALEKKLNIKLKNIGKNVLENTSAPHNNCENMIGSTQVPLGIAGPLKIVTNTATLLDVNSQQPTAGNYYIPLATTEAALVASINRGCKAIRESGGASVAVEKVGATRGPVFRVQGLANQQSFVSWLNKNQNQLAQEAEKTSNHLKLIRLETKCLGIYVFVRFYFDTEDAMGLNMITFAVDKIVDLIKKKTGIVCLSLSGNFCTDKKPSWQNIICGRGHQSSAEIVLNKKTLTSVLKTSADDIYRVWKAKCMIGSVVSGSMGFNAQAANVLSAIYLATGQDIAHVSEAGAGFTTCEIVGNASGLYISVYLPDLMVGTVGGGTGLATQKEALHILGIQGGKNGENSRKLAEIIGGAVLAGEISLLSSLEEGSLACAHMKLARGKR